MTIFSNILHDLKTPITAVKGYVEGIMDGVADTPEKVDKYIRTIYNKANEMDRLINELTFYSKIDTNRIPYTFSKINVTGYFDDCVEELGLELDAKGIELSYFNYADKDTMIIADASRNSSKGGSGIGLSIVKKIVEDHGGKIWSSSKLGAGTVMFFVLRKFQEVPIDE